MSALNGGRERVLTVGVVVARSGRLTSLGDPLDFAMTLLEPKLAALGPRGCRIRLAGRDSQSSAEGAQRAVAELVRDENAVIIVTLAGTQVLPAVADACETIGVPCLSSTFPWQVYYYGRGADDAHPFEWTYHFCWGLDDIAETFADLWEQAGGTGQRTVGCLWNDGPQGAWSRHREHGFAPAARGRGHQLVDVEPYQEPAVGFDRQIAAFRDAGATMVTSAATGKDLALFRAHAAEIGWQPQLITCSRWLAYPPSTTTSGRQSAQAGVATLVYWTPAHPYRSSIDGTTAAQLAETYEQATGRQWSQPLGLAYTLFEVAAHALTTADDPTERRSVASALSGSCLDTIAGPLDWTSGPVPNIATVSLAGGQWQPGTRHAYELTVVTSGRGKGAPVSGKLVKA